MEMICSHFTLTGAPGREPARFGFAERVAAAAEAGFTGIGLLGIDHAQTVASGVSESEMANVLADHEVTIAELEFVLDWSAGPDEPERQAVCRYLEDTVWAAGDAFAARVVSVGEMVGPEQMPPFDDVVERFAGLCDRAADHGLLVAIEFVPWSGIPDIATAAAIVHAADRPNAGINLDAWHWFRGRSSAEVLRGIADRIFVVQLDDADAEVVGSLEDDTVLRRRYPGDGSFDLVGLLLLLRDAGVDAPLSVEVMSTEHYALPVGEAARRAYDSTYDVIARAWH
jgi:sugar phosphate isomerase/epimerase